MWCDSWDNGLDQGVVEVGFLDGDLGVAHRVCPRTQVGLAAGAYAIVEPENFYGRIAASATLSGELALSKRTALYATIEGVRFEDVIGAIPTTSLGPGYTDVGASWLATGGERWSLAVQGKLVLPTAFLLNQNGWPLSADVGVAAAWTPKDWVVLHGAVLGLGGVALGGGPLFPEAGVSVDVGADWRLGKGFALVSDGVFGFGYTDVVDVVAAGVGVRGAIGPHAGLSLVGNVPLAGRERALTAADLRFDWRF